MIHTRDNRIVKITGDYENRNAGTLCETGRYKTLDEKRTRLTTPMKRVAGQLTATSWEDALTTLASKLNLQQKQHRRFSLHSLDR